MIFTIKTNTNNLEQDVLTTIENFSNEQLEQFISAIKLKKENSEIKGISIFFRYPECQQLLTSTEDPTKLPQDKKTMIRKGTYRLDTAQILKGINNKQDIKTEIIRKIIEKI